MSKHTLGPWEARWFSPEKAWGVEGPTGVVAAHGQIVFCNLEADARLIAAAPDLLEALKAVVRGDGIMNCLEFERTIDKAHAAIAKAEGKSEN
jgi:hypothetical protein